MTREREVRADTKLRYLEIAADLARKDADHEPAYVHAVSHIRLTDVATRAEVPRAALYRLWDTQRDYWRDLVQFIVTRELPLADAQPADEAPPIERGDDASLLAHLRWLFNRTQSQLLADPRLVLRATLAGYPRDPAVHAQVLAWERAERLRLAEGLARVLAEAGRAPVEPLRVEDLAVLIWTWADGVVMLSNTDASYGSWRLSPDDGVDDREGWSLTAFVARSLAMELTEASESRSPAPAPAVVDLLPPPRWSEPKLRALEAGADLFVESVDLDAPGDVSRPTGAIGHITVARLARAANVTRRQIYNVWGSHEELCRDLVRHLRDADYGGHFEAFDRAADTAVDGPPAASLTLAVAERMFRERVAAPPGPQEGPPLKQALEAHNGSALVRDENLRALRAFEAAQFEAVTALASVSDARMRPGLTFADLNRLQVAIAKGSVYLRHGDVGAIRTGVPFAGGSWSTFAIGQHAVLEHAVVRPSAPPRS